MATDGSLSGDGVTIWFAPADQVGTNLTGAGATAKQVESFVTSFDESGGERDVESQVVFGGGNINREKPQTQKELSFDIILRHSPGVDTFKKIESRQVIEADGTGDDFVVGAIIIQQSDGTNYYWQAYNNVLAVVFDTEFEAENEWRGTINFKLSPTNPSGTSNIKFGVADVETDLTSWS